MRENENESGAGDSQLRERLLRQVWPEPNTGCWLHDAHPDGSGYPHLKMGGVRGRRVRVSRLSWIAHFGPIPDGLHVLHTCDTRACCNPDHLWLGTNADNTADMNNKGRADRSRLCRGSSNRAAKTHCPRGHTYTPQNTILKNGYRSCRECDVQRKRILRRQNV